MLAKKITVTLPGWVKTEACEKIISLLSGEEEFPQTLLVGGCVRNILLVEKETDLDLATQYTPQQAIERLEKADIKVVPTCIDHGTITAILNGHNFEITTLRSDVETDGRHAKVSYTDSWIEDARRRDFTMNTLLMDLDGNIYDPLGNGVNDTQKRCVRFVGNPEQRIKEDYLRMLRFFRFQAQYGRQDYDVEAIKACQNLSNHIYDLSKERITQEFLKILTVKNPTEVLNKMFACGVLARMKKVEGDLSKFSNLCDDQYKYDALDVTARLSFFEVQNMLSLSNTQKKYLKLLSQPTLFETLKGIKKGVYYHGNKNTIQLYLLSCVLANKKPNEEFIRTAQNFEAPVFPVTGDDLIAEGYKPGPELGEELKRQEQGWVEKL